MGVPEPGFFYSFVRHIMRHLPLAVSFVALLACATSRDSIALLVEKLNSDHLWVNGHFPIIELPATAKAEEVVAAYFSKVSFDPGRVKWHKVKLVRKVVIKTGYPPDYSAALVETDQGMKIVLFRHERTGWWTRSYVSS